MDKFYKMDLTKLEYSENPDDFFDDPTHCRIRTLPEIYNLLIRNNLKILEWANRRQWINILIIPIKVLYNFFEKGYNSGNFSFLQNMLIHRKIAVKI